MSETISVVNHSVADPLSTEVEEISADAGCLGLELWQMDLRYKEFRIHTSARQVRLMASLAGHGQQSPVLVVSGSKGRYVLIDGYHRVEALRKLGKDTVEALILPMSEAQALVYGLREAKGTKRSALEEGWWIRELVEQHKFTLDRVAVSLERSKSWVSRRLALVKGLPEPVQVMIRRGKICPHAAMRYLVPLARANKGACSRLTEQIGDVRLSARQMGKLYAAWRRSEKKERARIEENPLLYLKAVEELHRDEAAERGLYLGQGNLITDLETLICLCGRLRQGMKELLNNDSREKIARKITSRYEESITAFESVKETMEEFLHAGH